MNDTTKNKEDRKVKKSPSLHELSKSPPMNPQVNAKKTEREHLHHRVTESKSPPQTPMVAQSNANITTNLPENKKKPPPREKPSEKPSRGNQTDGKKTKPPPIDPKRPPKTKTGN